MVLSSLLLPSLKHAISFGRSYPPIFSTRIRSTASLESEVILGAREGLGGGGQPFLVQV